MSLLPCSESTLHVAGQQGCVGAAVPRCQPAVTHRGRRNSWRPHCVLCGLEWAANAVLHPLPTARKPERQAWIDFVRRSPGRDMHNWTPSNRKSSYVCSLHFASCCILPLKITERGGVLVYERRLKPGAVPTIYPKAVSADGAASAVSVVPLLLGERGIDTGPHVLDDNQKKLTRGSFTVEDEAFLIDLVKERPLLWKRIHVNHFNQELKGVAYGQIASAFRGKFTVSQVRRKFLILRSQFTEENRKLKAHSEGKQGAAAQSHWVHYKRFMFMSDGHHTEENAKPVKEEDQEQVSPNDALTRGGSTTVSSLELDFPKPLSSECPLRGAFSQQSTHLIDLQAAENIQREEKQLRENYVVIKREPEEWCDK